ncbi:16S rRNA (adenine(1408)-N(1))-methyltransferase [Nocardia transvalensis]|uniref:16S rRNA (Adenine(1408)-N(1))-methyltransferase n=1 Tax=Nocardia transvalensis TaxID=37333 RepID=A0A7W9UK03_9NOCA|nr:class I SAM-dependent methyltransferase [Nocardia transvalensis]MBB5915931.1 16S rRNA (adenine(1408)-N(1))-methyltransferase [Nocardia transvalensis]
MGTGDGRAVLAAAAADPKLLVIGVDAHAAGMTESSRRALRSRDGLPNALFVAAAVENPPRELHGIADEVTVNFPWGSLLRGLLTADATVLDGLTRLMKPAAALRILLSVTSHDGLPGLPPIDDAAALWALAPRFADHGLTIETVTPAGAADVVAAGSSWGKRLRGGAHRPVWRISATRAEPTERAG